MNTSDTCRIFPLWFIVGIAALLGGCATPYQAVGTSVGGGFSAERIAANRFAVSFAGNGFTSPKRASDFALLRASELTLEYNYRFFTIDGQRDLSRTSMAHLGATETTTGTVSPYGMYTGSTSTTYNDIPIFKPGIRVMITCYDAIPEDRHAGRVYDAKAVAEQLRATYHMHSTASTKGQ